MQLAIEIFRSDVSTHYTHIVCIFRQFSMSQAHHRTLKHEENDTKKSEANAIDSNQIQLNHTINHIVLRRRSVLQERHVSAQTAIG